MIHSLVFLIENGEEDQDYVDELVEEGLDGDRPSNKENTASEAERARQGQNFRDQLKDKLLVYLDEKRLHVFVIYTYMSSEVGVIIIQVISAIIKNYSGRIYLF